MKDCIVRPLAGLRQIVRPSRVAGFAAALKLASIGMAAAQQPAAAPIKLGIVSFLSGPAASRSAFRVATAPKS